MSRLIWRCSTRWGRFGKTIPYGILLYASVQLCSGSTTTSSPHLLSTHAQAFAVKIAAAQNDQDIRSLEAGKPVERQLAGDEVHSYQIALISGQYLQVVVDQRGVNVALTLFGPSNERLVEMNSANRTHGREALSAIAEATGSYRLEVRSVEKEVVAGRYEARVEELRLATNQDKNRIAAQSVYAAGVELQGQDKAESSLKAIDKYIEALSIWRTADDRFGEANTLSNLGKVYYNSGQPTKALDCFVQELSIRQAISDHSGEAEALNNLGVAYRSLGELQKALAYGNQALLLRREAGDRSGEAQTLSNIGVVYRLRGEMEKALDYYNQALLIRRALGDRSGEAQTLNDTGGVYYSLGEFQRALDYYNQILPLRRSMGDRSAEAQTLNNIGLAYDSLGERQKALDFFNQALPLRRDVGDRTGEGHTLNNIGLVYWSMGENQRALEFYNEALVLRRSTSDRRGQATTLNNIGSLYSALGERQMALGFYRQALLLKRAVGDRRGEAYTLDLMGQVYYSLGENSEAIELYSQALPLNRTVGDRYAEAQTLNNIGLVSNSLGEKQKALSFLNQALTLRRETGDRSGEAQTLTNIGLVYWTLGENEKALDFHQKALPLSRATSDREGEALVLYHLALVERGRGNLTEACHDVEAAIDIAESVRTKVVSYDLRASYFASAREEYELYIVLLMELHKQHSSERFDVAALEASERARARSLLDLLNEARADIRHGVEPTLLDGERRLRQSLNAKAERQRLLLGATHTQQQATAVAQELSALTTEYQNIEAQIRARSPRYAALTQPRPLTLSEIQQQLLDSDTLLLEYALGDEHSYLWAVTQSSIASFELPRRTDVEAAARRVYGLLTARNRRGEAETIQQRRALRAQADAQFPQAAAALSQMVLSPVASLLKTKRLLIVSEGALQYIPFASLPTPLVGHQSSAVSERMSGDSQTGQPTTVYMPLMVDHEIVSLPSASTLAVLRRETAGRRSAAKAVAVLADPVFDKDDDRLRRGARGRRATTARAAIVNASQEVPDIERAVKDVGLAGEGNLARLPFSRREAEAILAVVPRGEGTIALDFKASRATATSTELGHYRIVHFATHGLLDSEHPVLSGVVFSLVDEHGTLQDGFLRLHDIYNLNLPSELVVLSACQTALGKDIRGEGLVGLTRGFMYAGAARVVASLWQVDDAATAELMRHFYRGMMGRGLRPAAALQAAQLEMWKQGRWKSPYYWAAFVLQGEWK